MGNNGWKTKYTEHKETAEQKMEEQIRELEKKSTLFEDRCMILDGKLKEGELQLQELIEEWRQVYPLPFLFVVCFCLLHLQFILCYTDRQERNKKNKT